MHLIAHEEQLERIIEGMRGYFKPETIETFRRLCIRDFYEPRV